VPQIGAPEAWAAGYTGTVSDDDGNTAKAIIHAYAPP
jgi:hypothetical protein